MASSEGEDDEETMEAEERAEAKEEQADEMRDLSGEANLPIDELLARYGYVRAEGSEEGGEESEHDDSTVSSPGASVAQASPPALSAGDAEHSGDDESASDRESLAALLTPRPEGDGEGKSDESGRERRRRELEELGLDYLVHAQDGQAAAVRAARARGPSSTRRPRRRVASSRTGARWRRRLCAPRCHRWSRASCASTSALAWTGWSPCTTTG